MTPLGKTEGDPHACCSWGKHLTTGPPRQSRNSRKEELQSKTQTDSLVQAKGRAEATEKRDSNPKSRPNHILQAEGRAETTGKRDSNAKPRPSQIISFRQKTEQKQHKRGTPILNPSSICSSVFTVHSPSLQQLSVKCLIHTKPHFLSNKISIET